MGGNQILKCDLLRTHRVCAGGLPMQHSTHRPLPIPHRWLLGGVCVVMVVITIAMMARAMESSAKTAASGTASEVVAADEDYPQRNPFPLPSGPRRFQEPL